jgi:cytochrome c oxidase subunit II
VRVVVVRRTSRVALVALVVLVVFAGVGCSADPPDVPEGADPVLLQGRDVFAARCVSCHGESGGGGRGPSVRGERMLERFPDPADQIAVIANGRGGMPAFGSVLSEEEIDAVVRYTREVL